MKAGKITAKLRDAVQVCFIEEGKEVKRYKNIDLPDALKELEIKDFKFHISQDEKITFHLIFDKGVLPEVFPPERAKMTRAEKAAAKAKEETKPTTSIVAVNIAAPTIAKDAKPATSSNEKDKKDLTKTAVITSILQKPTTAPTTAKAEVKKPEVKAPQPTAKVENKANAKTVVNTKK